MDSHHSTTRVKVWDLPVRLFHWLLVISVGGVVITGLQGGNAMLWHGRFGLVIVGLLAFRILWGLWGSSTARFTSFVRGPSAILAYLRGQWSGIGHNPLGALSVLGFLVVMLLQAGTGLFANDDIAFSGPLQRLIANDLSLELTGWHRQFKWVLLLLFAMHIAAIIFYTHVKKQKLVNAMISGEIVREPESGVHSHAPLKPASRFRLVLSLLIALIIVVAASGAFLPEPPPVPPPSPSMNW